MGTGSYRLTWVARYDIYWCWMFERRRCDWIHSEIRREGAAMPRIARWIARLKNPEEPTVYHVISRTCLPGYPFESVENDELLKIIKRFSRIYLSRFSDSPCLETTTYVKLHIRNGPASGGPLINQCLSAGIISLESGQPAIEICRTISFFCISVQKPHGACNPNVHAINVANHA